MSHDTPTQTFTYRAFVLRIWCDGAVGPWRASLQSVVTGERVLFNSLEHLCVYLLTIDENTPRMIPNEMTPVNGASAPSPPDG